MPIRSAMLCPKCQTLAKAGQNNCAFCGEALSDAEVAAPAAPAPSAVPATAASVAPSPPASPPARTAGPPLRERLLPPLTPAPPASGLAGASPAPAPSSAAAPANAPAPAAAPAANAPPEPGRRHSPIVALILSILIPGAGQAYNGRPIKGFFLLFASALVLPWFYSIYDAHATAKMMAASGGRFGKGGWIWVILQGWLAFNVAVAVLIVLTIAGVMQ